MIWQDLSEFGSNALEFDLINTTTVSRSNGPTKKYLDLMFSDISKIFICYKLPLSVQLKCRNCFLLDDCRNIEFREKTENMVLISHVIKSERVLKEENCQLYCYLEANCVSYNYGPAEDELYLCELSDKNPLQVPSDELEERHGFIYRPVTPVSKLKQRCQRSIY